MNPETKPQVEQPTPETVQPENPDRRELFQKFGKFAAYAAPFTVLAFSQKANAATGTGPTKHLKPAPR
jgi:hypothetical protein